MRWSVVVFLLAIAIAVFGCTKLAENANAQVAEQNIQQDKQYLNSPQVLRYPEHSITCFWWEKVNYFQCFPDYQLNTRNKYEG